MLTALVMASVLAVGQAAEASASSETLADKVKVLLGRQGLGSDELAKREAAERELVAIGPEVLSHLPTVNARTPAEEKNRLNRIRSALAKAEIEAATKPATVTLSGEMPVSEALAKISAQTGNRLIDYRERFNQEGADPMIKIELSQAPFWEALDTVLDAASLTLYNYDEERGALAFTARAMGMAPRLGRGTYSGLFRLEPTKIEATRDLRNPAMRGLRLSVDAVWEPRVRPIVLEVPLADLSAKDEQGLEIGIDRSEGTLEVPVEGAGAAVEIEFPLTAPERSVKTLASLQGKFTAIVLGKVESFEFADVEKAKSTEQERGGATVIVESCRKNGDIYDVTMRVKFERAANALESHRGWIYDNESYLLDSQGKRIDSAGLEATLLDVNEVGVSYKFNLEGDKPANYKFVYKTPAAIIRIPVNFELKQIDLP